MALKQNVQKAIIHLFRLAILIPHLASHLQSPFSPLAPLFWPIIISGAVLQGPYADCCPISQAQPVYCQPNTPSSRPVFPCRLGLFDRRVSGALKSRSPLLPWSTSFLPLAGMMGWKDVKRRFPSRAVPFWTSSKPAQDTDDHGSTKPLPGKGKASRYRGLPTS